MSKKTDEEKLEKIKIRSINFSSFKSEKPDYSELEKDFFDYIGEIIKIRSINFSSFKSEKPDYSELEKDFFDYIGEIIPASIKYTGHKIEKIEKREYLQDTFAVTFKNNVTFDYFQGEGHRVVNKNIQDIIKGNTGRKREATKQEMLEYTHSATPCIVDILYCLISDYNYDLSSFENFCWEMGYNTDSIKDQDLFFTLIENKHKIDMIFTAEEIEKMSEYFQNY